MRLNAGCNFDPGLLAGIVELNEQSGRPEGGWPDGDCLKGGTRPSGWRRVTELYGSVPGFNPLGTARPDFRLRAVDESELESFVAEAAKFGIAVNYTVNSSIVDPRDLHDRMPEIERFLARLQEIGVARVTVAHPLIAKIVQERSELPIELSTILALRNARQLSEFCDRCSRIDKVCLDVNGNRDFARIADLHAEAVLRGVDLEVLVNEFCVVDCVDRTACYDFHSLNLSDRERRLHNNYPMGNCIAARIKDPVQWLAARFILPQWFEFYAGLGIDCAKVSGRTHSTAYILATLAAYMDDRYDGNLLRLWADVENIGRAEDQQHEPRYYIDASKLDVDFLEFYKHPHSFRDEREYLEQVLSETMVALAYEQKIG